MEKNNILYIPIQINGDGTAKPASLLDRELYVLDNGTLYVGKKDNKTGAIKIMEVAGRVIPGATIENPTIAGKMKFEGDKLVVLSKDFPKMSLEQGQVVFVDEGSY